MKREIVIWGNSSKKIFIECANCGNNFSWLKAEPMKGIAGYGYYKALCRKCWLKKNKLIL